MKVRFDFSVNSVIESLILSDIFSLFSVGLLAPIFAIFVSDRIEGGDIEVIGTSVAIYWIIRSLLVTPLSRFMDKHDGESDEFLFMFCGTFLAACIPLLYIVAKEPWHIYVLQGCLAVAYSMAVPGWRILFTNHLDKGKTGYEWSLEDLAAGFSTALAAFVGSLVAKKLGFPALFACISAVGFMGTLALLPIRHQVKSRKEVLKIKKNGHTSGPAHTIRSK